MNGEIWSKWMERFGANGWSDLEQIHNHDRIALLKKNAKQASLKQVLPLFFNFLLLYLLELRKAL